jgi:hypothetical protein
MERRHGFNSIPNRSTSADGSHVVGWYVSSHREDRYDDDTNYDILLFEVVSEQEVGALGRGVHIRNDTREVTGKEIVAVKFHDKSNDTVVITYADGTEEIAKFIDVLDLPDRPGVHDPLWDDFVARTRKWNLEQRELGIKKVQERKAREKSGQ